MPSWTACWKGTARAPFRTVSGGKGEWRRWNGAAGGYEGLLIDSYYTLSVLITGRLGKGVAIP
jgi:hypothetical protein